MKMKRLMETSQPQMASHGGGGWATNRAQLPSPDLFLSSRLFSGDPEAPGGRQ